MRYSAWAIVRNALTGGRHWPPVWRDPAPQPAYDVVIIGGGGHGLATAFYLAKNHGITRVAVLERGYLGGGNVGRNTTIVRANYLLRGNGEFYSHSLKLWEGLEQELNYNVMMSQRGVLNLCHSDGQFDAYARRGNAMRLQGDDAELLTREEVRAGWPFLNFDDARFPVYGGLLQRRAGTARHDAVAWGYARAADARGVDLIQNCEVTGLRIEGGRVRGRGDDARHDRGRQGRDGGGRAVEPGRRDGWPQAADREPRAAGLRHRGAEAGHPRRRHLRHGAFLHQPVRQGRAGLRRRPRLLQLVRGAGKPADRRARDGSRDGDDADDRQGAGAALLGRHHRHDDGRLADHRHGRRSTGSSSTAAGATAGSRRRRRQAGASRT